MEETVKMIFWASRRSRVPRRPIFLRHREGDIKVTLVTTQLAVPGIDQAHPPMTLFVNCGLLGLAFSSGSDQDQQSLMANPQKRNAAVGARLIPGSLVSTVSLVREEGIRSLPELSLK